MSSVKTPAVKKEIIVRGDGLWMGTTSYEYIGPFSSALLAEVGITPAQYKKNFFDFSFVHPNMGSESLYLENGSSLIIAAQVNGWKFESVEMVQERERIYFKPFIGRRGERVDNQLLSKSLSWHFGPQTNFKVMLYARFENIAASGAPAQYEFASSMVYIIKANGEGYYLPLFNTYQDRGSICLGSNSLNNAAQFGTSPFSKFIGLIHIMQDGTWNSDLCYTRALEFYNWDENFEPLRNNFSDFASKLTLMTLPNEVNNVNLYNFS